MTGSTRVASRLAPFLLVVACAKPPREAGTSPPGGAAAIDIPVTATDAGAIAIATKDDDAGWHDLLGAPGRTPNVILGFNVDLVRKQPRMGPVLETYLQSRGIVKTSARTLDPFRDPSWLIAYGPVLVDSDREIVLVRYEAPDEAGDATVASIGADPRRVFMRPQSKLLVVAPTAQAKDVAATYRSEVPIAVAPNAVLQLLVRHPSKLISTPDLKLPESVTVLRHWIVPRPDGGAYVRFEADCTDDAAAKDAADAVTAMVHKQQKSLAMRFATRGLLEKAAVVTQGATIKLYLDASTEQVDACLQVFAAFFDVKIAPPPSP